VKKKLSVLGIEAHQIGWQDIDGKIRREPWNVLAITQRKGVLLIARHEVSTQTFIPAPPLQGAFLLASASVLAFAPAFLDPSSSGKLLYRFFWELPDQLVPLRYPGAWGKRIKHSATRLAKDELRLSSNRTVSILANEAASSPGNTAATAAASAPCASYAGSATAYAAPPAACTGSAASYYRSSAASAPPAASAASCLGILLAGHISFFIENKERSQANVEDFLFIESELR